MTAREARNSYYRKWRSENKDKVKKIHERYWQKKAASMTQKEGEESGSNSNHVKH